LTPNTVKIYRSDIKHVSAFFTDALLNQIRPMHIKQFLNEHSDKPTTANRFNRLFSTVWN
jgi:site-specific recombinase XerD